MYPVLLATLFVSCALGQESDARNPTECVNKMIEWCNGIQHAQNTHMVVSQFYSDLENSHSVYCVGNSLGTNCSRDGTPWFNCTPDSTLIYKGQVLTSASSDVTDDICDATFITTKIPPVNLDGMFKGFQGMFTGFNNMYKRFGDMFSGFGDMFTGFGDMFK